MTEQEECSVCCACRRLRRAVGVGADRADGGQVSPGAGPARPEGGARGDAPAQTRRHKPR